jgi:NADH-quinone oxidoreductase subunit N
MWVPDVYEGAPTPVTAFFSIGPKAAGVAALLRIFMIGFGAIYTDFAPLFWLLAFLTMTVGNVLAVMQNDVKRMLAYSSIAHAGYLLVAVTAGGEDAVSAALFYLLAYGFFNMGAFAIVILVENKSGGSNHLDTFRGLAQRRPWLAVFLALFMFSLAGFPPTAGFFGKFYIFAAAINAGLVWLVILAVLNSLISVYYYLRPVKAAFFDREKESETRVALSPLITFAIVVTVAGTLVLGVFPGYFLKLATASVFMIM